MIHGTAAGMTGAVAESVVSAGGGMMDLELRGAAARRDGESLRVGRWVRLNWELVKDGGGVKVFWIPPFSWYPRTNSRPLG